MRRQHRARPDPAHLKAAAGEQLTELLGAIAPGDSPVRPGDEHHVRLGHVDQVRPAALLGKHRHAEGERVHAGEQLPARPEHASDLGDEFLGGQPQGERALFGDHPVGAAVRKEGEAGPVGGHGGQPAANLNGRHRGRRGHFRVDDAQHVVPGACGDFGGARSGARYVDEESVAVWQPVGELSEGDGSVEAGVAEGRIGVLVGPCGDLHGVTPGRAPIHSAPHCYRSPVSGFHPRETGIVGRMTVLNASWPQPQQHSPHHAGPLSADRGRYPLTVTERGWVPCQRRR